MKPHLEKRPLPQDSSFLCARRNENHFEFNWHVHDCHELVLILEGHGQRFIGDHIDSYRQNDLVLVGANLPHSWVSAGNDSSPRNQALYIQFCPDFLGSDFFSIPELRAVDLLLKNASHGLLFDDAAGKKCRARIRRLYTLDGFARLQELLNILNLLAMMEHHAKSLASPAFGERCSKNDSQRIQDVLKCLHNNLSNTPRLEALAGMVNMSRSTFARFFKRATGKTVVEYLNDIRVGQACTLLMETDLSVGEICFRSGFTSLPYFNRRFLLAKGMSPTAYRQKLNALGEDMR